MKRPGCSGYIGTPYARCSSTRHLRVSTERTTTQSQARLIQRRHRPVRPRRPEDPEEAVSHGKNEQILRLVQTEVSPKQTGYPTRQFAPSFSNQHHSDRRNNPNFANCHWRFGSDFADRTFLRVEPIQRVEQHQRGSRNSEPRS